MENLDLGRKGRGQATGQTLGVCSKSVKSVCHFQIHSLHSNKV